MSYILATVSSTILLAASLSTNLLGASIIKVPTTRVSRCEFRVEPLKTLKYAHSEATCINDHGEIVGVYGKVFMGWEGDYFFKHSFLISTNGELKTLDLPPITPSGLRINNASQIAGTTLINDRATGFLWDPEKGITFIESLGGRHTKVLGLNDLGQVVGYSETGKKSKFTRLPVRHAFVWENGKTKDLGTLQSRPGLEGDMSEAIAINNLGEIVGMSNYMVEAYGTKKIAAAKPFYWNGIMQAISCGGKPVAINNKSKVALTGLHESFIWSPHKGAEYLIPYISAIDLNDNDMLLSISTKIANAFPVHDEVVYYQNGKSYRGITFVNANPKFRFIDFITFNKINNRNEAVGRGPIEGLNELQACVLKPINTP
jgi:probable HAF family extracellular repeat protein